MTVLLTGGCGMVGRNVLEHPAAETYNILAPNSSELNLLDQKAVEDYLSKHSVDMVVHAAGRVGGIQANTKAPVAFLVGNLDMGRNLVVAAQKAGVKKFLNLGSSCMYPRNAPNPLQEDMVLKGELEPTNEGYALAKIVVARLCEYISKTDETCDYKTVIPCNLYGRHDKFDPAHSHLVPALIHKLHQAKVEQKTEVDIWGTGNVRREFMYAGDLANCLMKVVADFSSVPPLMNIGLGYDYSILEYYKAAAEVVGYDGDFVHDLTKPEGMAQKLVSTEKLTEFGWSSVTSLKEGMAKTYEYYLEESRT